MATLPDSPPDSLEHEYPLLRYVAITWMEHADLVETESWDNALNRHCIDFLSESGSRFLNWWRWSCGAAPAPAPLHHTVRLGLYQATKCQLENQVTPNHRSIIYRIYPHTRHENATAFYGFPLHAASYRGSSALAELLLDYGADINSLTDDPKNDHADELSRSIALHWMTALQVALHNHRLDVALLLITRGADINASGGQGNALYLASKNGYDSIVELLLDKGADINAKGQGQESALSAASHYLHVEVVKVLLAKGADVNAPGIANGTVLQATFFGLCKENDI